MLVEALRDLSDDRHAGVVAAHLEHCDPCGIEAEFYERVKDQLRELHRQPDPDTMARLRHFADRVPTASEDDPTG